MSDELKIARFFRFNRVILPVIIGLGVATWLIVRNIDLQLLEHIRWTSRSYLWLSIALLMIVARDLGYILRIRLLTDYKLQWKQSFQVIMLWEFASALTPSVVGGSALATLLIHKERISIGRATAVVMITALLDELFYIIIVPIVLLLIIGYPIFSSHGFEIFGYEINSKYLFIFGYLFMVVLVVIIAYAIFINPRGFKWLLIRIFKMKWTRKWRYGAMIAGNDIIITSGEMKGRSIVFWAKAFGTTFLSWSARFMLVNFLILAFLPVDNHLHIYASQLVMWVIMLVSPTPGSAGVAEISFNSFLSPFLVAGLAPILALFWRVLTSYIYIIIGSIVLPIWLARVFAKKKPNIVE
jgi:uncharacterized protein (TIRG00374 family)